jgi:ABC-type transport system substrate-binding protein
MNVNDMYRICQFAINKAQNGYLTPSEFNLVINQAQISYQDYLLGEFQQYQYGRPQARVNYSQNEDIRQRLTPLIAQATLAPNSTSGIAAYPTDFLQVDAMWEADGVRRVRFVPQDSLYSYYNSEIDPIISNPIYLLQNDQFQFYPKNIASISGNPKISYVKSAPDIIWGYTTVSGRPVYNPTPYNPSTQPNGSQQPVWYDVDILEIITRALKLIGLNLQDGMVEQYANQITQTGQ